MRSFYSFFFALLVLPFISNAQFTTNGTAVATSSTSTSHCFQLTPTDFHVRGSVFSNTPINLNQSFEINARLYLGNNDGGADGIAFVLQNEGPGYIGNYGAGLGYHRFNGIYPSDIPADVPGPVPSFIVEFDTWQNGFIGNQNIGDPAQDHLGFMSMSNAYHTSSTTLQAPQIFSANIEDGQWHDVKFSWNATTKQMTVQFTTTNTPLVVQNFSYTGDIVNTIFGGNGMVYWGFTAATGSVIPNEHGVCVITPADCGQLRTQTPGGWGAPPNGNNPGSYLHSHFATAFPTGLRVGVTPNYNVLFTTAQAITDYLPAGGPAKKLTQNYTNPATTDLKNVLVDHLVALTLSVRFDDVDPNFGQAGITLGDMIIGSGPFAGWTVRNFLAEANKVLGGTSTYTVQQALETAAAINENYVDGRGDNGFLDCPTSTTQTSRAIVQTPNTQLTTPFLRVYPNPAKGSFVLEPGDLYGKGQIVISNSNGGIVEQRTISIVQGQPLKLNLDKQPAGMYFIKLTTSNGETVQKVLIQR